MIPGIKNQMDTGAATSLEKDKLDKRRKIN